MIMSQFHSGVTTLFYFDYKNKKPQSKPEVIKIFF